MLAFFCLSASVSKNSGICREVSRGGQLMDGNFRDFENNAFGHRRSHFDTSEHAFPRDFHPRFTPTTAHPTLSPARHVPQCNKFLEGSVERCFAIKSVAHFLRFRESYKLGTNAKIQNKLLELPKI